MKRKDWKTKKSIKNIFDKFLKRRRIFFLRKLNLRKNLVLKKKNLIMHFFFFLKFINSLKFFKKKNILRLFNYDSTQKNLYVFPDFFYKKKIFQKHIAFKNMISNFNLNYIFLNNFKNNYLKKSKGNSILFYGEKKVLEELKLYSESDENKNLISLKYFNPLLSGLKNDEFFNFYFYFNINMFQNIEIYKILTILFFIKINHN